MKKLMIFTNHFYPESFRINALSKVFSEDYDVEVITQIPNYPLGSFFDGYSWIKNRNGQLDEVKITRLPVIPRRKSSIMLAINYISYVISSYLYATFTRKKVDHVFAYVTSPIFVSWAALKLAKRRKVKSTMYLLDLWPDSLTMSLDIKSQRINRWLDKISMNIYNRFDTVIVSSAGIKEELIKRGIRADKLYHLPQHADELFSEPIKINPIEDKVKIVFTGNIGTAQGLDTLVDCAKILNNEGFNGFHFTIVGDGRHRRDLEQLIETEAVSKYFTFTGQVKVEEVSDYLKLNHFGYVSLENINPLNLTLPAKVQSYMASGIPIIACGSDEIINTVKKANCGYGCKLDNPSELANLIKEISHVNNEKLAELGYNGYKYCLENFDIKDISRKFIDIMKEGL